MLDSRNNKERKEDSQTFMESKTTSTNPQTIGVIIRCFEEDFDSGQWENCMMPSNWDKKKSRTKSYISNLIYNALHAYEEATRVSDDPYEFGSYEGRGWDNCCDELAQKRKAFWGE